MGLPGHDFLQSSLGSPDNSVSVLIKQVMPHTTAATTPEISCLALSQGPFTLLNEISWPRRSKLHQTSLEKCQNCLVWYANQLAVSISTKHKINFIFVRHEILSMSTKSLNIKSMYCLVKSIYLNTKWQPNIWISKNIFKSKIWGSSDYLCYQEVT